MERYSTQIINIFLLIISNLLQTLKILILKTKTRRRTMPQRTNQKTRQKLIKSKNAQMTRKQQTQKINLIAHHRRTTQKPLPPQLLQPKRTKTILLTIKLKQSQRQKIMKYKNQTMLKKKQKNYPQPQRQIVKRNHHSRRRKLQLMKALRQKMPEKLLMRPTINRQYQN